MQVITTNEQIAGLKDNFLLGEFEFINSSVVYSGTNNILIAPFSDGAGKIILRNANIGFRGSNSIVFLCNSVMDYKIDIEIYNNSFCYIGTNNFFNNTLYMKCAEQSNIVIGQECLFSFGVWIRTSDAHLIYDIESRKRVNPSKSVLIGDLCWIGQDAKLFKGTQIGSGSIMGASAFVSNKRIKSNSAWGGNPAKMIRDRVYFAGSGGAHLFTDADISKHSTNNSDYSIFNYDEATTVDFNVFEKHVMSLNHLGKRVEYLVDFSMKADKNRFYIG